MCPKGLGWRVKKINQSLPEGPIQRTSKYIAFLLLILYSCCLLAVFYAAFNEAPTNGKIWFDLFKSGFLILGGALTTIIGYYFGSRGVQEAEASLNVALREAEKAKEKAEEEKRRADALDEEIKEISAPMYDEVSLTPAPEEEEEH